ncbi:hypothetical protein ACFL1R_11015 [Candidatus Latescibacterota bacterium]
MMGIALMMLLPALACEEKIPMDERLHLVSKVICSHQELSGNWR